MANKNFIQSQKTNADKAREIQELLKNLSVEERMVMEEVLKDLQQQSQGTLLDKIIESEYIRPMVDIETFVNDPYYLGNTCSDTYPQLMDDLRELEKGGYDEAVWCGSTRTGKCALGNTEIFDINQGLRRQISEIDTYLVTAIDENTGKIHVNPAQSRYSGEKDCIKIITSAGDYIEVSKDHKIFTPKGWVEAGKLKNSDYISSPRYYPEPKQYLEISDDEVKLVAYLLSDGGCTGNLTFTNASKILVSDLRDIVQKLGETRNKIEPSVNPTKNQSGGLAVNYSVNGVSRYVNKWDLKHHARDKRIPAKFYGLNKVQIGLFLNRFWACDGTIMLSKRQAKKTAQPSIEICLASEFMIKDIKFLLGRLGIYSRVKFKNKKYTYKNEVRSKPAWNLNISGKENIIKFIENVGLVLSKEAKCQKILDFYKDNLYEKLDCSNTDTIPLDKEDFELLKQELKNQGVDIYARNSKFKKNYKTNYTRSRFKRLCEELYYNGTFKWLSTNDLYWEKIVKIENVGTHPVYDLSVNENHNFIANNIVIHNSFVSSIVICRFLYRLSCMRDPQRSLGIAPGSKIACIVLSANEQLAREVAFDNIVTKVSASPYFKENFEFKDNKGELIFPNNIVVIAKATTDRSALGFNIALFWLDEAGFFGQNKKVDPKLGHMDNAEVIYRSLKTRMKNTFKKSKFKGMGIISSSLTTFDNFMTRHIKEAHESGTALIRQRNAWTILPELYEHSPKFKILVGNELMASRILALGEEHTLNELPDGVFIEEIPEEFRPDFENNLEASIRDLLGRPTTSISPFIQQRDRIIDAYDVSKWPAYLKTADGSPILTHNFKTTEWTIDRPGEFVWDRMVTKKLQREYDRSYVEVYKPIINPNASRAIHLDPSLKNDSSSICMAHIAGLKEVQRRDELGKTYVERAPVYIVDFILRINPPATGEIEFSKVRDLVYQIQSHGYSIATLSMDKYLRDGLQPFQQKGFTTEWVSVDETTEPYDVLKSALYERRIYFYKYDRLIQELQLLEKVYEGKRVKIDHPSHFSKDLADSLAGAIFSLSKNQNMSPMPMIRTSQVEGDPWMAEQLHSSLAGNQKSASNTDYSLLVNNSTGWLTDDGWTNLY